jgi:hypothetical protein
MLARKKNPSARKPQATNCLRSTRSDYPVRRAARQGTARQFGYIATPLRWPGFCRLPILANASHEAW